MFKGDDVEVLGKKGPVVKDKITDIIDSNGQSVPFAQPGSKTLLQL